MDDRNDKRPVLHSAEELKGRKAKPKRKARHWLIILLCFAVLAGGYIVYDYTDLFKPAPVEQAAETEETVSTKVTLIDREAKDFESLTTSNSHGETYTIVNHLEYDAEGKQTANPTLPPNSKEGEDVPKAWSDMPGYYPNYSVEGKPYFVLSSSQITSMITYAKLLEAQDTIEENAKDLSIYGLSDPAVEVQFNYKDGTGKKLFIGDKAPAGTYCYAMIEGDSNVYTIFSSVKSAYDKKLNALHTVKQLNPMAETGIANLLIERKGKKPIELKLGDGTEQVMGVTTLKLIQPIVYDAHSARSEEMFTGVVALALNEYAGHYGSDEEKAAFGLDDPSMHIRFGDAEGNVNDLYMGSKTDEGFYYVTVDDSGDVYTISEASLAFTNNATVGYLVDQFTNLVNIMKVKEITIEADAQTHTLGIEGQPDPSDESKTIYTYTFDGEVRDEESFKKIYQEIIGVLFDKISDNYHFVGKVVAKATYKFNDDRENFVVEYLDYDRDYYATRRDGQTLFLIKKEKISKMLEALQQYHDGSYEWR